MGGSSCSAPGALRQLSEGPPALTDNGRQRRRGCSQQQRDHHLRRVLLWVRRLRLQRRVLRVHGKPHLLLLRGRGLPEVRHRAPVLLLLRPPVCRADRLHQGAEPVLLPGARERPPVRQGGALHGRLVRPRLLPKVRMLQDAWGYQGLAGWRELSVGPAQSSRRMGCLPGKMSGKIRSLVQVFFDRYSRTTESKHPVLSRRGGCHRSLAQPLQYGRARRKVEWTEKRVIARDRTSSAKAEAVQCAGTGHSS